MDAFHIGKDSILSNSGAFLANPLSPETTHRRIG